MSVRNSTELNNVCKLLLLLGTSSLRPFTGASPLDPTAEPVYPDPLRGLHPWTPLLNLCTQTLYGGFTFGPHCWTCVPRPSTGASPLDPTAEPVYPDPLRGLHLWTPLLNLCTQTLYGGFTLGPHCWICVPRPSTRASPLDPTAEPVYPDPLRGLHRWTPLLNLCTQTLYEGFTFGPHCWTCVPRPSTGASSLDPTAEPCLLYTSPSPRD